MPYDQFHELMFKVGAPLGWDKKYVGKSHKQKLFINMIEKSIDEEQILYFESVLDQLALIYVLKKEVASRMEGQDDSDSEDEVGNLQD